VINRATTATDALALRLLRPAAGPLAAGLATAAALVAVGCGGEEGSTPKLARSFQLTRPSGRVVARLCDGRRIAVRETVDVRFGCTVVDARRGAVTVVAARDADGHTQSARFNAGAFRVVQRRSGLTEAILVGGAFGSCTERQRHVRAFPTPDTPKGGRRLRRLLAEGSGQFRTRGHFATGTVRGTSWGTQDFCHGTLLVVRQGRLAVRDLVRHRTIGLTAPDSYFARAPR
jgi:hypothetical protein